MPITVEDIEVWLPQTQCTRCGYPSCHAYAQALVQGSAEINQCPPGGDSTLAALANLLERVTKTLNPKYGRRERRQLAVIDEPVCIGCRKCVDVCPVDAILGARQVLHTVLAAECSGCALCLPVCPVDCIALQAVAPNIRSDSAWPEYRQAEVNRWRMRSAARRDRLQKIRNRRPPSNRPTPENNAERIRSEIRAAVARVRAKKSLVRKPRA